MRAPGAKTAAAPRRPILARGLILLAVVIGVLAAVAVKGRMAHLRALAGDALPPWTAAIDPTAGLLAGGAGAHGARLTWQAMAPDGAALVWRLGLVADSAPETPATGRLALSLPARTADLTLAGGAVALSGVELANLFGPLPGLEAPLRLSGRFALDRLAVQMPLGGGAGDLVGTAQAGIRDLQIDGTAWGQGTFSASAAPGRPPGARLVLTGGVAGVQADLTLSDSDALRLTIAAEIDDTPGLPADLRGLLQAAATRDGPLWRLGTTFALQ